MIDDFAKEYLHSDLREIREAMLRKLDGLSEYDIRRPVTSTGTNLLGLVKHLSVWESRATIAALAIDSPGYVPWWPRPDVMLFNVLVHMLTETSRHAGHADILREQLDDAVEMDAESLARRGQDAAFWENRRAEIERAAKAADPAEAGPRNGA